MHKLPEDILLIDKPAGMTSFDVIRCLRRQLGIKKMGHAGTLDPLATGLMIIGTNKGTKKLNEYLKLPKIYEAEVLLGQQTTTGDLEGEVIAQHNIESVDVKEVKNIFQQLIGIQELPVPRYSAIKVAGQRLYKKARQGEDFEPPVKPMQIDELELLDHYPVENGYVLKVKMAVGSGAYVRSISEEIGRRLEVPATTQSLRRTQIGDFLVNDAQQLQG